MKKIAFVAAALLPLTFAAVTPSFAATKKTASVCANKALSAEDKKACKSSLSMAKGKSAKAHVRTEYQAKIDAAKKH